METRQKRILIVLGVLLGLAIIAIIIAAMNRPVQRAEFTPPPMEENAVAGVPEDVNEMMMYTKAPVTEDFTIALCGVPTITYDGQMRVYFTNDETNEFMIRAIILAADGKTQLGESGLLKPGEYVEYIHIDQVPKYGEELVLRVQSFEEKTYFSRGAFNMNIKVFILIDENGWQVEGAFDHLQTQDPGDGAGTDSADTPAA
ncbi:MAG: hypothetical protein J1E40_00815 [Oscillospiraceae bacterium]|nr:hypothetical protein [Oscillospiraceae bacterium]